MTATDAVMPTEDTYAGRPPTAAALEARARIIVAAVDQFGRHGFDTGLGAIADAANVRPGATVVVKHVETGRTNEFVTNAEGRYLAPSLQPGTYEVTFNMSGFQPRTVTVNGGDTVIWRNMDTVNRQVVANNGSFASPILAPNRTYTRPMNTPGFYRYHDTLKPTHIGAVRVVGPAPSVAAGVTPPKVVSTGPRRKRNAAGVSVAPPAGREASRLGS